MSDEQDVKWQKDTRRKVGERGAGVEKIRNRDGMYAENFPFLILTGAYFVLSFIVDPWGVHGILS